MNVLCKVRQVIAGNHRNVLRWTLNSCTCASTTPTPVCGTLTKTRYYSQRNVDKTMEQSGDKAVALEDVDMAVPNEGWTEESKQLFDKLTKLTESGEWFKHKSVARGKLSQALFTRSPSIGRPAGEIYEYAFFINKKEHLLKGVCQFGPLTEGPPRHAHGGSIAAMIDAASGVLVHQTLPHGRMTANMNINYKRPTPLMTTVLIEAEISEVVNRKTIVSCKVKNAADETLHVDATLLFITVESSSFVTSQT